MKTATAMHDLPLDSRAKEQVIACLNLVKNIVGNDLLGVYLYGSSVVGGLQKYSDIDLFVVVNRVTTYEEKKYLVAGLLNISGVYMKSEKAPIEMTIVEQSAVNPWHYPPIFDFQYGEWLRTEFEQGIIEPWPTKIMSDLALLITQVLLASKTLFGAQPDKLLCPVPYKDFMNALCDSLPSLLHEIESDTRNVLLTLARMWSTVATDEIRSKPAAAAWAIDRLPQQYRVVMERARAVCVGQAEEQWDDIQERIKPCADFIVREINDKMCEIMRSDHKNKSIKLA